jgi:hypothetical protein
MKITFYNASELKNIKCAIHKSGKLGFSFSASKQLKIDEAKSVMIGTNSDDKDDQALYMLLSAEPSNSAFKIGKAGSYYYLSTKELFDKLGYDYRHRTIIFDLVEMDEAGQKMYKMNKREVMKKKKN